MVVAWKARRSLTTRSRTAIAPGARRFRCSPGDESASDVASTVRTPTRQCHARTVPTLTLRSRREGAAVGYVTGVLFVGAVAGGIYLLGHPPGTGAPARVLTGVDDVTVVATSPVDSAMEAAGGGTVGVVDGCLGFVGTSTGEGTVVSWPRGSRPLDDRVGVRLPTGLVIEAGDHLEVAGGTQQADDDTRESCGGVADVFFFGYISR